MKEGRRLADSPTSLSMHPASEVFCAAWIHAEATFVHPDKLGREPTDADRARAAAALGSVMLRPRD